MAPVTLARWGLSLALLGADDAVAALPISLSLSRSSPSASDLLPALAALHEWEAGPPLDSRR